MTLVALVMLLMLVGLVVMVGVEPSSRDSSLGALRVQGARATFAADAVASIAVREVKDGIDHDGDGTIGSVSDDGSVATDLMVGTVTRIQASAETVNGVTTITARGENPEASRAAQLTVTRVEGGPTGPMTLTKATQPAGVVTLFNAVGIANTGGQKSRLESRGQSTRQGGNPGNGWWTSNPRPRRSWEVIWDHATSTVTFNVYANSSWQGTPAMDPQRVPQMPAGQNIVGLNIGCRLAVAGASMRYESVQFNNGSGWVDVADANVEYSTIAFHDNYFALGGVPGSFRLRGVALFPSGATNGDSMRFYITALAGPVSGTGSATTTVTQWSSVAP